MVRTFQPPVTAGLVLVLAAGSARGEMYDVFEPFGAYTAPQSLCSGGCLSWQDALPTGELAELFATPAAIPNNSKSCAIPARPVGLDWKNPCPTFQCNTSFYGPICPCLSRNRSGSAADGGDSTPSVILASCEAPKRVPEQINLQLAAADTVVVAFVTFEDHDGDNHSHGNGNATAPEALLWKGSNATAPGALLLRGVTHTFVTSHDSDRDYVPNMSSAWPWDPLHFPCARENVTGCQPRKYAMHFVKFGGLAPRAPYSYKVRAGSSPDAPWSQMYTFRAPYGPPKNATASTASPPTRVAIFGDMGLMLQNNMANLLADCASEKVDAIVMMGDHCYNLGMGNDMHGDAYMNAFQPVLARCPWLPIIGNHESTRGPSTDNVDESSEERYLNQTWGVIGTFGGDAEAAVRLPSTATTALGHLLTKGTYYAAGQHGNAPRANSGEERGGGGGGGGGRSRTSQWTSVDIGLIHFVTADLNPGEFEGEQQAWVDRDLAAAHANRASVPWVVVTSHFPLYNARLAAEADQHASMEWYDSDVAESERTGVSWVELPSFERCDKAATPGCVTVDEVVASNVGGLGSLLDKYEVDLYNAGHVHSYSRSWPIRAGLVTAQTYVDPNGTVFVTEGNGGVPIDASSGRHPPPTSIGKCPKDPRGERFPMCGTGQAYGRLVAHNGSVLTYEHVDNMSGNKTDEWHIVRTPNSTKLKQSGAV